MRDLSRLVRSPIILASASKARRAMLEAAGLSLIVDPANIDEAALRHRFEKEGITPEDVVAGLARDKARAVCPRHPEHLVLGCDQILLFQGQIFEKPGNEANARKSLTRLSGHPHELLSAAVLARDGAIIWAHTDRARLTMRVLSDAFIEDYLKAAGSSVFGNVGAYALEGLGAQLFSRVEGDFFTILGLPLLPLLAALRSEKIIPA